MLNERERDALAALEAALTRDDPWLARRLTAPAGIDPRRTTLSLLAALAGTVMLVAGIPLGLPLLSVAGFLTMLAAARTARLPYLAAWLTSHDPDERDDPEPL